MEYENSSYNWKNTLCSEDTLIFTKFDIKKYAWFMKIVKNEHELKYMNENE